MNITALSSSTYGGSMANNSSNGTITQLEKEKEELNEELEEALNGKNSRSSQDKVQEIRNEIAMISMKISLEKAKQRWSA